LPPSSNCLSQCLGCDCSVFDKTNNSSNCTFSELFPAHINTILQSNLPSQVKLLSPQRLQSLVVSSPQQVQSLVVILQSLWLRGGRDLTEVELAAVRLVNRQDRIQELIDALLVSWTVSLAPTKLGNILLPLIVEFWSTLHFLLRISWVTVTVSRGRRVITWWWCSVSWGGGAVTSWRFFISTRGRSIPTRRSSISSWRSSIWRSSGASTISEKAWSNSKSC